MRIARRIAALVFVLSQLLVLWPGDMHPRTFLLIGTLAFSSLTLFLATESFGRISREHSASTLVIVRGLLLFAAVGLTVVASSHASDVLSDAMLEVAIVEKPLGLATPHATRTCDELPA